MSTGGTQALEEVLSASPRVCPGIMIAKHMAEELTVEQAWLRRHRAGRKFRGKHADVM